MFSFGVIADPQYADVEPLGTRFYRNSLDKLEKAVEELNGSELKFVVTLGDLIDRNFASFGAIMPIYAKLKHPHFPVLGNHDFDVTDEEKGKVLGAVGMDAAYYAKQFDGWRFLFLDGTDVSVYRQAADDLKTKEAAALLAKMQEEKREQGRNYNAAIGEKQMEWIAAEIEAASEAKERVILFNHYPAFPKGPLTLWNDEELVALITKHKHVAAYMNGHDHAGNYAQQGGTHFLNLKGMVETAAETAYSIVHCYADRLVVDGYGAEPDRELVLG